MADEGGSQEEGGTELLVLGLGLVQDSELRFCGLVVFIIGSRIHVPIK